MTVYRVKKVSSTKQLARGRAGGYLTAHGMVVMLFIESQADRGTDSLRRSAPKGRNISAQGKR